MTSARVAVFLERESLHRLQRANDCRFIYKNQEQKRSKDRALAHVVFKDTFAREVEPTISLEMLCSLRCDDN